MNEPSLPPQMQYGIHVGPVIVIGIGSPHGDDRAGWEVIDRLHDVVPQRIVLRKASVPHDLLDWLDVTTETHLIDARCDKVPGLKRFNMQLDDAASYSSTTRSRLIRSMQNLLVKLYAPVRHIN